MSELRFDKDRLVKLMEERGLGDTELARRVGVSRTMIFYLRKGKRTTAKAEVMQRIADALGTTMGYLLGEDASEQGPMQNLPGLIRQVAEIMLGLSKAKQEEVARIVATLAEIEREQTARPLPNGSMRALAEAAEKLRERGDDDDLLALLDTLLRGTPPRWMIDLGNRDDTDDTDTPDAPEKPENSD